MAESREIGCARGQSGPHRLGRSCGADQLSQDAWSRLAQSKVHNVRVCVRFDRRARGARSAGRLTRSLTRSPSLGDE
jgi:hypothetical protein